MKRALLPLTFLALLGACGARNDSVYGERILSDQKADVPQPPVVEPDKIEWITVDGGEKEVFKPQVDVLFVIDNSDSMKSAQENLSANINRFVEGFSRNRMIDYHVGVVSVWDRSERFLTKKKDPYAQGELRYIKDAGGRTLQSRFVSRFKDAERILAATLKIGIAPYADGGPEDEELFSPLSAALKKTGRGDVNEGFFREDAHLAVVMITDADDSTANLTPEETAQELIDFKGGRTDKVSAYGALVKKSDPDSAKDYGLRVLPQYHPECFDKIEKKDALGKVKITFENNGRCKDGFGPDRIEKFLIAANPGSGTPAEIREKHIMSLVQKDFGDDLAKIGSDITVRTMAKEIFLSERPRKDDNGNLMMRVRYGSTAALAAGRGQIIPQKEKGGWLYDAAKNSVRISGDIVYVEQNEGRFVVDMVPQNVKAR